MLQKQLLGQITLLQPQARFGKICLSKILKFYFVPWYSLALIRAEFYRFNLVLSYFSLGSFSALSGFVALLGSDALLGCLGAFRSALCWVLSFYLVPSPLCWVRFCRCIGRQIGSVFFSGQYAVLTLRWPVLSNCQVLSFHLGLPFSWVQCCLKASTGISTLSLIFTRISFHSHQVFVPSSCHMH